MTNRGGRPKLPEEQRKSARVQSFISEDQKRLIDEEAARTDRVIADIFRCAVLGYIEFNSMEPDGTSQVSSNPLVNPENKTILKILASSLKNMSEESGKSKEELYIRIILNGLEPYATT